MSFGKTYCTFAKYFIHVYHHIPLSHIKSEYRVDLIKDLITIYPNYHAMSHKVKDGSLLTLK